MSFTFLSLLLQYTVKFEVYFPWGSQKNIIHIFLSTCIACLIVVGEGVKTLQVLSVCNQNIFKTIILGWYTKGIDKDIDLRNMNCTRFLLCQRDHIYNSVKSL